MLKRFVALSCTLLVGTVLVFGLSGCGDKKDAAPAGGGSPAEPAKDGEAK